MPASTPMESIQIRSGSSRCYMSAPDCAEQQAWRPISLRSTRSQYPGPREGVRYWLEVRSAARWRYITVPVVHVHCSARQRTSGAAELTFRAGIRESLRVRVVPARVSEEQRGAIVASPRHFESHPKLASPRDLTSHRCISISMGSAGPYRWEFEQVTESLTVDVHAPPCWTIWTSLFERQSMGSAWRFRLRSMSPCTSQAARSFRVLEDWCPPFAGFFLYHPSRRQQPAALSALIDTLRLGRSA